MSARLCWLHLAHNTIAEQLAASTVGVPQPDSFTNATPVAASPIASQPFVTSSVPDSDKFDADEAIAAAIQAFQLAVQKMSAAGGSCDPEEVAKVLNLQKIEFASGSEQIPPSSQDNLRESARLIKTCVEKGDPIHLEVAAFTESGGSQEENLHLSHKRASAVRAHLVAAVGAEHLLTARGYGEARPVASNGTARGRFANRRIEFLAVSR